MYIRRQPHLAVGVVLACGLLAPTWMQHDWGPLEIDAKMAAVAAFLLAYCCHPQGKLRFPIQWLDCLIVSIFFTHLASEAQAGELNPTVSLRAFGEWLVPYLSGRCLGLYRGGITRIAPWFAAGMVVIAIGAVYETLTGVNPWERLFVQVDDLVKRTRVARYGWLYRAAGPTRHPIFLGVVSLLMIPWCVVTIERARSQWMKGLGWTSIVCVAISLVATVSRGPLLALFVIGIVAAAIRWTWLRKYVIGGAAVGAIVLFIFWSSFISIFERTDSVQGRGELVVVEDQADKFTGTRNRILIWKIYGPLVLRGGPLGFGTTDVSSFPPNIPGIPTVAKSAETLGIVDNTYLLVGLRFGWIGVTLLVVMILTAITTAIWLRNSAGLIAYPYGSAFWTALAASLTGAALEILTVFGSYEFMFWLLFTIGTVAGSGALRCRMLRGDELDAFAEFET
jgi:hypothetical protein